MDEMLINRVGLYGTGKVALSFGYLLKAAGFEVAYFGRSVGSIAVQKEIEKIGAKVLKSAADLLEWSDALGVVITDGAIGEIALELANIYRAYEEKSADKYLFHMSGALDSKVLGNIWTNAFSFHPLRAFAKVEEDLKGTTFALEIQNASICSDAILGFASKIEKTRDMNIKLIRIESDQKVLYHASAVIASNFIVPLIDLANKQLERIGLDDESLLWPLIDSAIANMKTLGVKNALTGPVARGDFKTVEAHLSALDQNDTKIYSALCERATQLSRANQHDLEEIRRLIGQSSATINFKGD